MPMPAWILKLATADIDRVDFTTSVSSRTTANIRTTTITSLANSEGTTTPTGATEDVFPLARVLPN